MNLPTLIAEVGFAAGPSTGTVFLLDDEARGLLGTNTLAGGTELADISEDLRTLSCQRGSSRIEGPIVRYEAGTSTALLRNDDRQYDPTNLSGPYVAAGASEVTPMRIVRYRAVWDGVVYDLWRGFADSWQLSYAKKGNYSEAVLSSTDGFKVLSNNERVAVSAVGGSEDAGARVARILDSADWDSDQRDISDGDATLQSTTLSGSALTELFLVSDTELGELYINGAGEVVFRNRNAVLTEERSNTSQTTFSDDRTAFSVEYVDEYTDEYSDTYGVYTEVPELPYDDIVLEYDDTQLINVARIARTGGTQQEAEDTASVASYLTHTYERTDLLMESDTIALEHARFIVFHAKDPELRFAQIVIDPQRDPDNLFPQVLGREIGDRITVKMAPDSGDAIVREVFIRGIAHDITRTTWKTTWTLQSATKYAFFVLDNDTLGTLDENALAY